ncbi:MAG: hypothetical protein OEU26_16275 [Candidatus Tectomicrobia bacterium]|nr:hypothetical protein [Candidatus Tectomicrobia bacterium]
MLSMTIALLIFVGFLVLFYVGTLRRTKDWIQGSTDPALKGLALPEGSIRGLLAFMVVGAFVIFVFFGGSVLVKEETKTGPDGTVVTRTINSELYTAILTAFGTLTGAVTGFYFGGRTSSPPQGQLPQSPPEGQPE